MDKSKNGHHPVSQDADFQPMYAMQHRYADDEISLVDLGKVLVRRKKTIIFVFIMIVLLALATAVFKPKSYEFRTAISIGQVKKEGGDYHLIEPADYVLNKVSNSFITEARLSLVATDISGIPSVTATIPKDSGLVLLKTPVSEKVNLIETANLLHSKIADSLIADHESLTSKRVEELSIAQLKLQDKVDYLERQAELKQKLAELNSKQASLKLALEKVSNKTLLSIDKDRLQQKARYEEKTLAALNQQLENLQQRIALQPEKSKLVNRQLKQAEIELANLQKSRARASGSSSEALLIVDSQIQTARENVRALENLLLVGIPDETGNLQKQRVELIGQIKEQEAKSAEAGKAVEEFRIISSFNGEKARADLTVVENEIETIKSSYEQRVSELRRDIAELENLKQQIIPTRIQIAPHKSIEPSGISGKLILALGIVLGFFVAIIAAVMKEFIDRVNSDDLK